tara:strand:- start:518 stop:925 length:408 start_codon:yes stop_codon:yes gene_type:complete
MKVYIAGAITGYNLEERRQAFLSGAAMAFNFLPEPNLMKVINPMDLEHDHDKSWRSYMQECIVALTRCDAIFMMPCWSGSKGANLELKIAEGLGLKIYFAHDGGVVQRLKGDPICKKLEPKHSEPLKVPDRGLMQ